MLVVQSSKSAVIAWGRKIANRPRYRRILTFWMDSHLREARYGPWHKVQASLVTRDVRCHLVRVMRQFPTRNTWSRNSSSHDGLSFLGNLRLATVRVGWGGLDYRSVGNSVGNSLRGSSGKIPVSRTSAGAWTGPCAVILSTHLSPLIRDIQ